MILVQNSKYLSSLLLCKRVDLGFVDSRCCFLKRRLFRRGKCHLTIVEKFAFFKKVNPWFWSKITNMFRAYFFVKETLVLSFNDVFFLQKEAFYMIKKSFYYSRKSGIFPKGLTYDSFQKFQISFESTFV